VTHLRCGGILSDNVIAIRYDTIAVFYLFSPDSDSERILKIG